MISPVDEYWDMENERDSRGNDRNDSYKTIIVTLTYV